jgi:hypothetical protein
MELLGIKMLHAEWTLAWLYGTRPFVAVLNPIGDTNVTDRESRSSS